jgi:urea transport system ATP-binding protein
MLLVKDLNQYYGGSHILRNVSFEVPAGKVTTLLGRNGVGKTTLLKTLMGLVAPRTGEIVLESTSITGSKPYERVRAGLGYVPQGREIFPRLTVEENLEMGLATRPRGAAIPPRIFEMFPVLKQMLRRRGGDLSGGQQQQLAIGRALAADPEVLLLDEPSLGLAPKIVDIVFDALTQIRDAGLAVLLVEQRAQRTVALADESHVLANGELRLTLGPKDAADTDRLVAAYLA